jgi:hypothetical protein
MCIRMNGGVRIEIPLPEVLDKIRVRLRVDGLDLRARRGFGLPQGICKAEAFELPEDRLDPLRGLDVARQVDVARALRRVDEHGASNPRVR